MKLLKLIQVLFDPIVLQEAAPIPKIQTNEVKCLLSMLHTRIFQNHAFLITILCLDLLQLDALFQNNSSYIWTLITSFFFWSFVIMQRERPLMTSHVFWQFLTYPSLVLPYNVRFWELSWTHLPTLIWDVINGRSPTILSKNLNENSV